jgi:hypothetical protein
MDDNCVIIIMGTDYWVGPFSRDDHSQFAIGPR